MRKEYEMTQEQLDKILEACKPVPMIALQCGMVRSQQEMANAAWAALGEELGFHYMTVRPNGPDQRFFSAEEAQLQWRWVDEQGRAMTHWKQSEPPPIREVKDTKGPMHVEIRMTT